MKYVVLTTGGSTLAPATAPTGESFEYTDVILFEMVGYKTFLLDSLIFAKEYKLYKQSKWLLKMHA